MGGFRGLIASASLKQPRPGPLRRGLPGIPRLDCLGLIEATRPAPHGSRAPFGFRGLIASASLKRTCRSLYAEYLVRFRGLIASASLKLGVHLLIRVRTSHRFRGLIASASLKRARRVRAARSLGQGFRGLIASASLKQRLRKNRPHPLPRFRGLIASASLKPVTLDGEKVSLRDSEA